MSNEFTLSDDRIGGFLDQCYASGIKDPLRFLTDKMPRLYGFLKGAFPRGILPTDIDGEVEINGYFLRMEFKHESALRQGRVPRGQLMCFESLINTGRFTVFIVGHDSAGAVKCIEIRGRNGTRELEECDHAKLYEYCKSWADYVGQKPRPKNLRNTEHD